MINDISHGNNSDPKIFNILINYVSIFNMDVSYSVGFNVD